MLDPKIFESPLSLLLAAATILLAYLACKTRAARLVSSRKFSVAVIVIATISIAIEGSWGSPLHHHWSFLLVILLTVFALIYTSYSDFKHRSATSLLSHLGLLLVLFGGLFGSADVTDVQMKVLTGEENHYAYDSKGRVIPLPFGIELDRFETEYYEDGVSPKQYSSEITIDGTHLTTSVNHPCRYKGYNIYQSGFDPMYGRYSVFKIVRDPWLPVLAIGALMLALSAVLSLKKTWNSWKVIVIAVVLAVAFTLISVAKINFGTLMPALRSLWFVPHLIVYMLAYAVMALAVISGIASLFTSRITLSFSHRLLSTASSLMLFGMLCGAVWAKQAWGDYWTWDAKECWAAVTWLFTLAGTHAAADKGKLRTIFTVLAFLAMQMTWYGVNYLPSSEQSLHTYNQQ